MATTISKKEASMEQALAGTTAVLGGLISAAFLAWMNGTTLVAWDPTTILLFASLIPTVVTAQFALNTTRPPHLPVKAALRFTALALGMIVVLSGVVGVSAVNLLGLIIPPAAMGALVTLAATAMAGLAYAKFELADVGNPVKVATRVATLRTTTFEPTHDRAAMRDFDARLRQALAEAQIELDFSELEQEHTAPAQQRQAA